MLSRLLGTVSLDTRHVLAVSLPSLSARHAGGARRRWDGTECARSHDASNQRFQAVCDGVGPGSAWTDAGSQRTCLRSIEGVS